MDERHVLIQKHVWHDVDKLKTECLHMLLAVSTIIQLLEFNDPATVLKNLMVTMHDKNNVLVHFQSCTTTRLTAVRM